MRHSILPSDNEFDQVGYGKTSKLTLQKGVKIAEIILVTKNIEESQLLDTVLTLDSDPKYNAPYARLADIEKYLKRTVTGNTTHFSIPFADFSANSIEGQEQSGLQILNENAVLKVTLGAATAQQVADGDVPEMYAIIVYGIANLTREGQLVRGVTPMLKEDTISIKKTGDNNFHGFEAASPLGINMLKRAIFYGSNIAGIEVKVKSSRTSQYVSKLDLDKATCEYFQKREKRAPIADAIVFDPLWLGFNRADLLNPELAIQFVLNTTDSNNVDVVYQSLLVSG